jgi:hypothetical protein
MLRGVWVPPAEEQGRALGQFVMLRSRIVATLVGGVLWVGIVVAIMVVVRWCTTLGF